MMIFQGFTVEQEYFFLLFMGMIFIYTGMWREGILYFFLYPNLKAYGQYEIEITVFYVILLGLVKFWITAFGLVGGSEREK